MHVWNAERGTEVGLSEESEAVVHGETSKIQKYPEISSKIQLSESSRKLLWVDVWEQGWLDRVPL